MDILKKIQTVHGPKSYLNDINWNYLGRRLLKLSEEKGELSQAFLDYTSNSPSRGKTMDDLVEEAVDTAIVALDIALVLAYGEHDVVNDMVIKKINKWKNRIQQDLIKASETKLD